MKFDAVIVAAGSASRMGRDKLLLPLGEEAVLLRTTELFCRHPDIQKTIVVCRPDQRNAFRSLLASYPSVVLIDGGATRHLSVKNGLREVSAEGVVIHDGARPFLSHDLIDRVMEGVRHHGAATPAAPVPDAVRVMKDGFVTAIAERDALCRVATPQGFVSAELKDAFERYGLFAAKVGKVQAHLLSAERALYGIAQRYVLCICFRSVLSNRSGVAPNCNPFHIPYSIRSLTVFD